MEKSKQAKTSELEDGVDRISNLPDPILHLILSGFPTTEEVVRTSILSTRWRHLWTLIPSIDIDYSRGLKFERNKFKRFVDHVLSNNSLDLDSFRVSCSYHYSRATVNRWIDAAVKRNIKQLHLLFCSDDWFKTIKMPDCLETCDTLQVLRLFLNKGFLILPKFTGFPALRVLELNNVDLKKSLVKNFLESCPLLEDLSMINCVINCRKLLCISCPNLKNLRFDNRNIFDPDELYYEDTLCGCIKIDCPKLVSFEFGAFVAQKYIFKSLGLLEKLVIHPEEFCSGGQFMGCELWYARNRISHLVSLSTSIDILCCDLCPSDGPPSLPNLKTLELTTDIETPRGIDTPIISILTNILTCLPLLESLHLIIFESYLCWEDWKFDEAEMRNILTCHLKKVEFHNFNKEKLLLDIARSLLEHGNALEEMVLKWNYFKEAKFHESSKETMKEVSKFQKASSTVKLFFLNEINRYQLSGRL